MLPLSYLHLQEVYTFFIRWFQEEYFFPSSTSFRKFEREKKEEEIFKVVDNKSFFKCKFPRCFFFFFVSDEIAAHLHESNTTVFEKNRPEYRIVKLSGRFADCYSLNVPKVERNAYSCVSERTFCSDGKIQKQANNKTR